MGHLVMLLLHVAALLWAPVGLLVTIPLHLIYGSAGGKGRDEDAPRPDTHVRCPDCRELVRKDARRCRFCGLALKPQD